MTLNELIAAINNNLQDGPNQGRFIVLSAAVTPEFGTLVQYLNLNPDQLQVNNVTVIAGTSDVRVTGVATLLNYNMNVTVVGSVPQETPLLQLTAIPDPVVTWTFATSFQNLPDYVGPSANGFSLEPLPSFFNQIVIASPAFVLSTYDDPPFRLSAGLNLTGRLQSGAPFDTIPIISGLPWPLQLYGTIDLSDALRPKIDLRCNTPTIGFDLGQVSITRSFLSLRTGIQPKRLQWLSKAVIGGTVMIGRLEITVTAELFQGDGIWVFTAAFLPDQTRLTDGLAQLAALVSGSDSTFVLPTGLSGADSFYLSKVAIGINLAGTTNRVVNFISVTVQSDGVWRPPVPKTTIGNLYFTWTFNSPTDPATWMMFGTIGGQFRFGDTDPVLLNASISIPQFSVVCELEEGSIIPVSQALRYYFGYSGDVELDITELRLAIEPREQSFVFYGNIETDWQLLESPFPIVLQQITVEVIYRATVWSGRVTGVFFLFGNRILLTAENRPSGGWLFAGEQYPGEKLGLGDIITYFLGITPGYLPALNVSGIGMSYATVSGDMSFKGQTDGFWTFVLTDTITLKMRAAVAIQYKNGSPTGEISGIFMINNLVISASYAFEQNSSTLKFLISYKKLTLTATLVSKNNKKTNKKERILTIGFGDLSFGEIVEYLSGLANPNITITLDSPWDMLYDINFKNLTLTVNLDTNEVGIHYKLGLNLVFVNINTIGLVYRTVNGKGKVAARITGRFLDQEYSEDDPLTWDLADDPPPQVPGKGAAFIDIRYVGLGQHIAIDRPGDLNNVREVIDVLRDNLIPPEDKNKNPLQQAHGLHFDENSHWLFGLDITLMGMVRLAVVFNDPYLFGLLVGLSGDRSGSLKGLEFEVLYVKITDDIGVFRIELRLPEAFRQLEFGAVSVTLPVLGLEIYTNGDFRVDLGFPRNRDFTRSFCLQVFPFVGYGGFYFAKLSGRTSKRVPAITNGTFDPVIEFGLGLSIGVGKTFNKGPLKAGLSLTVEGIVEGTLAWFNPTDKALPDPMYFWMQGTIAIVGKLYGEVDFVLIKVNVSVTAFASVTLVIAAYAPIVISLRVGVEVEASIKILFVRIHFSFGLELKESFVIGDWRPTPWILQDPAAAWALLGGGPGGTSSMAWSSPMPQSSPMPRLRMQRPAVRPPVFRRIHTARFMKSAALAGLRQHPLTGAPVLNWNPSFQVFAYAQQLQLTLVPFFTVAVPSTLPGGSGNAPQVQAVMALFAENTLAPQSTNNQTVRQVSLDHVARTGDPAQVPFNLLLLAMLAYVLDALPDASSGSVTSADLELLNELLSGSDAVNNGFSYANLSTFLQTNFVFLLSTVPPAATGTGATGPANTSGTIFPMFPALSMQLPGSPGKIDFAGGPYQVDSAYEAAIRVYFQEISAGGAGGSRGEADGRGSGDVISGADGRRGSRGEARLDGTVVESFATAIFCDYFLLLARSAVQEAIKLLEAYPYLVLQGDTLIGIAGNPLFPRVQLSYEVKAGDTWQSVANLFNMTLAALQALNPSVPPGESLAPPLQLQVESGVTVQEIATANQDHVLNTGTPISITGVLYQAKDTDTLAFIAARFFIMPGELAAFNSDVEGLLDPGGICNIWSGVAPGGYEIFDYVSVAGDTLALIAAWFLVRNAVVPGAQIDIAADASMLGWYAQTIYDLNSGLDDVFGLDNINSLPVGTPLLIPGAYNNSNASAAINYTTRGGDTLDYVAGYFALVQNPVTALTAMEDSITGLNPGVVWAPLATGTSIVIPALSRVIQGDDTILSLSLLYGIRSEEIGWANARSLVWLAPLAVLRIPAQEYVIAAGDTLAGIAANYNLSIDELALDVATVPNLFPPYSDPDEPPAPDNFILIRAVQNFSVDQLLVEIVTRGHANNAAAAVSRFLAHGLRLPLPVSEIAPPFGPATALYPVYALTQQQITAPDADIPTPYAIVFTNTNQTPWISLATSYTVQPGDTQATLLQQFPQIVNLNPDVDWADLEPGWVLVSTSGNSELVVSITPAMIQAEYPSTVFKPQFEQPQIMELFNEYATRYSLQNHLHWQTAKAFGYPQAPGAPDLPKTGEPGIWMFPSALLARVKSASDNGTPYALAYTMDETENFANPPAVGSYTWGGLLGFSIRAVPDTTRPGQFLANTYELGGSEEKDREMLLQTWSWLSDHAEDVASLYLLYPPNAATANPNGLISDETNGLQTYLLKTNLSTETTSGNRLRYSLRAAGSPPLPIVGNYQATLDDPVNFVRFLWEGVITGTGGYYLHYSTKGGGAGLPPDLFDQGGGARIWLAVMIDQPEGAEEPDRALRPFFNCAIIGDNLDPATMNVFAMATDASDLTRVANVPPGLTGFDMLMENPAPDPQTELNAELRTRVLYSLFGYRIVQAGLFSLSNQGLPAGPTDPRRAAVPPPGLRAEYVAPWHYHQVIPVATLAVSHPLPQCPALPDPLEDPYAGIGIDPDTGALGKTTMQFNFYDLFGNSTTVDPSTPLDDLEAPVGYYDPIIGLSQWPALAADYIFTGSGFIGEPLLNLYLGFRMDDYIPGPGVGFEAAVSNAATHLWRYKQIYYQLQQADVALNIGTSLVQTTTTPTHDALYPVDPGAILGFVSAAYVFLTTAARMTPGLHPIVAGDTLMQLTQAYHCTYGELASANGARKAVDLFAGSLNIPYFLTTAARQSLNEILQQAGAMNPPAPLDTLTIVNNNPGALLSPGIVFAAPSRPETVNTLPGSSLTNTLRLLAAQVFATPEGLAAANAMPATPIIRGGIRLQLAGLEYTTTDADSFVNIAAAFNAMGASVERADQEPYTIPDVAGANADVPGLIVQNAALAVDEYQTQEGDLFTTIQGRIALYTPAALLAITANNDVKNIYMAGQPLLLFSRGQLPFSDDTITDVATTYGITTEQLFVNNPVTGLQTVNHGDPDQPTNVFSIPSVTQIGNVPGRTNYVPYATGVGDSLDGIAAVFYQGSGQTGQLAALNRTVTWIFVPGEPVQAGSGQPTATVANDSLRSLLDRINAGGGAVSFEELVAAIGPSTTILKPGAFLACPLPGTGNQVTTLGGLTQSFHVPAVQIARANASLAGFLTTTGSVTLYREVNGVRTPIVLLLGAHDTFHSLVLRYKLEQGVDTTVTEIAVVNAAAPIIAASYNFLLPPAGGTIVQGLGQGYAANPIYPSTIFEVRVTLTIQRDKDGQGLFSPGFDHVQAVKSNTSPIAPQSDANSSGQLSLAKFASTFETAFPNLKIGLGKADPDASERHLWAVYFGTDAGISSFSVDADHPAYFALRPLSTTLISRNKVNILAYNNGALGTGTDHNYQGVDLEVWAGTLLEAIDLFLSPAYAAPASLLTGSNNAYNRVVEAKLTLAGKIAQGLDYVTGGAGDPGRLEKARATLRDKLLIDLSKAYDTDALVQYDVSVSAEFPGQAIAPRFSGVPLSKLYRTGPADNITVMAIALHITTDYLLPAIAGLAGILNTGLTVNYPSQPGYPLASGDTLTSVAAHFGVSLADLVTNLSWADPQQQGLFAAGTTVDITGAGLKTGARTIRQIASRLMVTIPDWALANKDNTGLFQDGVSIPYPGRPAVTVAPAIDTLALVAAAFQGDAVSPADLAISLADSTTVLAPEFISYVLLPKQDFRMSSAKTSLATGTNQVNFLLNVKSEEEQRRALLGLRYSINELEFNIRDIRAGYQASSWLSFLLPFGAADSAASQVRTDLGLPEIPLPLRDYPGAPTIGSQLGKASYPGERLPPTYPDNIEKAREWDFSFVYRHEEAAQDAVYLSASFNLGPSTVNDAVDLPVAGPDFFTALARFIAVWPAVRADLEGLLSGGAADLLSPGAVDSLPPGAAGPVLEKAADSFATLLEDIVAGWNYGNDYALGTAFETSKYKYRMIASDNGRGLRLSVSLYPLQTAIGPGAAYPDMYYTDRQDPSLTEYPMEKVPGAGECTYYYPFPVPVNIEMEHRIEFTQLDILQWQNAIGGAYVTRNEFLTENTTNPGFVFRTPEVLYNSNLTPLLQRQETLLFRNGEADLQHALVAMFTALIGNLGSRLNVSALYGYELVAAQDGGADAIISLLPIVFLPVTDYDDNLPVNLSLVIDQWQQGKTINASGGRYVFDLTIFSNVDPGRIKPLLRLQNLVYLLG